MVLHDGNFALARELELELVIWQEAKRVFAGGGQLIGGCRSRRLRNGAKGLKRSNGFTVKRKSLGIERIRVAGFSTREVEIASFVPVIVLLVYG